MRTISKVIETYGRVSPNTGGRPRYAKVSIRGEPALLEGKQLELVDESNLNPDYLEGVREGMERVLKGSYPDVSVRVVITAHQDHPVDSSRNTFRTAGEFAMESLLFRVYENDT